jgi:serine/threonine-protein kinase
MDEHDEALSVRARERLGTTLRGKYRLDRVLGIGGMATVFAATHRNQAELAVKLLHPELSLREDLKKRFLREGYVGNSVKHPGAVLVVDDDVSEDGSAFLVMELLRGKSLEDVWEKSGRALSSRVVTSMALQLLDVLAAAHDKAIVHRDLKPANLFLTLDGSIKVLDFGIARLRDSLGSNEHATRTGTLMGTPAFMAPEQAQAIAAEIDGQTDLWAVGATMYTLMSGHLVHDGDNSSQLLIRAGTSRAGPLSAVAPKAEPAIAAVVDKALTFEKSGRWPSAHAMRDALQAAAVEAFGQAPGRDVLSSALASASVDTVISPGHVVVGSASDAGSHDPTFATPADRRTPPPGSMLPPSGTSRPRSPSQPALPGLSTGNAVSAESPSTQDTRKQTPRATIVAVAAVLVAAGAVGYGLTRPGPRQVVVAAPAVQPSPPVPASASPPPPSAAPAAPPSAPPAAPPSSAVASAAPAPVESAAPAASATAGVVATSTKLAKPPPVKPAAKPAGAEDCTYSIDPQDGHKIWSAGCNK